MWSLCHLSHMGLPSLGYVLGRIFLLAKRTVAVSGGGLDILMEWREPWKTIFHSFEQRLCLWFNPSSVLGKRSQEFFEVYKWKVNVYPLFCEKPWSHQQLTMFSPQSQSLCLVREFLYYWVELFPVDLLQVWVFFVVVSWVCVERKKVNISNPCRSEVGDPGWVTVCSR